MRNDKLKFKNKFIVIIVLFLFFANIAVAKEADSDKDGLSNEDEINIYFTNPNKKDTDGDRYSDKVEIDHNYSPTLKNKKLAKRDTDKDGLDDDFEKKIGTDIKNPDSDGDGYKDGMEVINGFDPLSDKSEKINKSIKVSLKDQKLSYYFGKIKLDEFKISSGVKKMPTPVGKFKILKKFPTKHYGGTGFDFPNTLWNLQFTTKNGIGYYVHGAYWHNNFGHPMSHGCVNVSYDNMERLYNFAEVGAEVEIK